MALIPSAIEGDLQKYLDKMLNADIKANTYYFLINKRFALNLML